ncbi:hypothetical protein HRI97_02615 [Treponema socranskii subsp. buccale]|uniref:DUF6588 family protein n=1 Tax=Treponema socranskii TaxID=53419 RepID=UPI0020A325CC|nr:DUF6588 family protein [Treponema socranskii]UTD02036.1 hypothetical protein HRI97_02615 [Treponema socranskii subsp. buccale]
MRVRSVSAFTAALLLSAASAFASTADIDKAFESLNGTLTEVVPETTIQLGVWSDAYIGKLFPSFPPHFGAGVSAGGTFIETKALSNAIGTIITEINSHAAGATTDFNFTVPDQIPLPSASVHVRIGGFILPFDIGVYGAYFDLNTLKFEDFTGTVNYYTIGGDIRYAIMKGSTTLPKLSVGAGYIRTHLAFSMTGASTYSGTVGSTPASVTANADTNTSFDLNTIFVQAQISKKFLILTPYAGVRAYVTSSKSHYDYSYSSTYEIGGVPQGNVPGGNGSSSRDYGTDAFNFDWNNIRPQLYAGLGLNLLFVNCTVGGSWNMRNNLLSANVNVCIKI